MSANVLVFGKADWAVPEPFLYALRLAGNDKECRKRGTQEKDGP